MSIIPGHRLRNVWPKIIEPYHYRTVFAGMTYGEGPAGYDIRMMLGSTLAPGEFKLESSLECFHMPDYLLGYVKDKSTWARRGLAVQNTVIEPGWRGYLALELTNHSADMIVIHAGSPIAQIVFHRLEEPARNPYSGKYQDQEAGIQPARFEE